MFIYKVMAIYTTHIVQLQFLDHELTDPPPHLECTIIELLSTS